MINVNLFVLFLTFLASPVPQNDRYAKIYSIQSLRASAAPANVYYGSFLIGPNKSRTQASGYTGAANAGISSAECIEILRAATAGSGDAPRIDVYENSIVATATGAQHQTIAAVLQQLDASAGAPVEVNITVLSLAPGAAAPKCGVLTLQETAAAVDSIKNQSRVVWQGAVDAKPGAAGSAGSVTFVPFVISYKAEVAKKSKIGAPVIAEVIAGFEATVNAIPVRGGDATHVSAILSFCDLLGIERYDTRGSDIGNIERPQVAGLRLAANATIPSGGSLLLRGDGADFGTVFILLRPRAFTGTYQFSGKNPFLFIPAHPLTAGSGRSLPRLDSGLEGNDPPPPIAPNFAELLKSEGSSLRVQTSASGAMLLIGDEASLASASERLRAFEETELITLPFEFRVVRAADSQAALAPNATLVSTVSLSVTSQRTAGAVAGRQELAVEGYGIQIAEEANIAEPRISELFRGFSIEAKLLAIDAAGATLSVAVEHQEFGPRERIVSASANVGDHERVSRRSSRVSRTLKIAKPGPVLLGELGVLFNTNDRLYGILTAALPAPAGLPK
ncbi:MAG: hypothetical protein ACKVS6_01575 [Planctomycetota bacterium]